MERKVTKTGNCLGITLLSSFSLNGYRFVMNQKDAEDMTVDMVNHIYSSQELSALIEKHCIKV